MSRLDETIAHLEALEFDETIVGGINAEREEYRKRLRAFADAILLQAKIESIKAAQKEAVKVVTAMVYTSSLVH